MGPCGHESAAGKAEKEYLMPLHYRWAELRMERAEDSKGAA